MDKATAIKGMQKVAMAGKHLVEDPKCSVCQRTPDTDKYTITVTLPGVPVGEVILCLFCFADGLGQDVRTELYRQWYGKDL